MESGPCHLSQKSDKVSQKQHYWCLGPLHDERAALCIAGCLATALVSTLLEASDTPPPTVTTQILADMTKCLQGVRAKSLLIQTHWSSLRPTATLTFHFKKGEGEIKVPWDDGKERPTRSRGEMIQEVILDRDVGTRRCWLYCSCWNNDKFHKMSWDFTHVIGSNSLPKNPHEFYEMTDKAMAIILISVALDLSGEWLGALGSVNVDSVVKRLPHTLLKRSKKPKLAQVNRSLA